MNSSRQSVGHYLLGMLLSLFLINACAGEFAPVDGELAYQVLVTFTDRSVGRSAFGKPGARYTAPEAYDPKTAVGSRWSRRLAAAIAREHDLIVATEWPITSLGVHCAVYRVAAERDVAALLKALSDDARVHAAQPMNHFTVMGSDDPYRPLQSALRTLDVDAAHQWATGRNVRVGVVDTGIDATHPDLLHQVTETNNYVTPMDAAPAGEIHGTAVAGVIAARGDNGVGIVGVAPNAHLIGLKACWPIAPNKTAAECNTLTLARALDAVIRARIPVLNLSLGGPADLLLTELLNNAMANGTVVVVAEPIDLRTAGFPSRVPGVLRVRSADQVLANGTAGDPDVIAAPGDRILTTMPDSTYSFVSGSSFAAAHVSGIVALLKEVQPALKQAEVRRLLFGIRESQNQPHALPVAGMVSACAAIQRLISSATCVDPQAPRTAMGATRFQPPATVGVKREKALAPDA